MFFKGYHSCQVIRKRKFITVIYENLETAQF